MIVIQRCPDAGYWDAVDTFGVVDLRAVERFFMWAILPFAS